MEEQAKRENISENGKIKRMIIPGAAIAAAGAALVTGARMRRNINIDDFRERFLRGQTNVSEDFDGTTEE